MPNVAISPEDENPDDKKPDDKNEGEKKKEITDFLSKFSASNKAPVDLGGSPDSEVNKKVVETLTEDETKLEDQRRQHQERKRAGSNIPQLVEDKKKAEKERDELKTKYDDFETKVKPDLEKKISELQAKIDSGDFSSKKEQEFQSKITELEGKLTEKEQDFISEKKKLQDRLAFYDLSEDEEFQREYVAPINNSYREAVSVIGGDRKKLGVFQQALSANLSVINATSEEEKSEAVRERRALIASVVEDMNDVEKSDFLQSINLFFRSSERHSIALKNHNQTTEQLKKRRAEIRDKAMAERYGTWNNVFEKMGSEFSEDDLTDDELKLTKELGIDVEENLKKSDQIAKQTIAGKGQITDAIRIIHEGRQYHKLKARLAIKDRQLKEKDELIAKLRSGSTSEGEGDVTPPSKKTQTIDTFYDRFRKK